MSGKRVRLVVLDHREPVYHPVDTVPRTRSECPDTSSELCPHWKCRANLLRTDSGDRAGRPSVAKVQRSSATGYTVSQPGALGAVRAPSTIEPRYLGPDGEPRHVESCLWDAIERHGAPMDNVAIGRHRTLTARIVERALAAWIKGGATSEGVALLADPEAAIRTTPRTVQAECASWVEA